MSDTQAFIAQHRFGLGGRPDELKAIAADPRGWLKAQLADPRLVAPALEGLSDSGVLVHKAMASRKMEERQRQEMRQEMQALYQQEIAARSAHACQTQQPFRERLVAFFSNHFSVSRTQALLVGLVGNFERQAIRPFITRRFSDMLLASTTHPAMLFYLDNIRSAGAHSIASRRRKVGLNENLAREVLELHTVGVRGGYDQQDVTSLANVLTGWSVRDSDYTGTGQTTFEDRRHEPGSQTVLGHKYAEEGPEQLRAVLRDLSKKSETATHIATKLVRHFIADAPPKAAVDRVAKTFLETDGDLVEVGCALVDCPEAWSTTLTKFKSPWELVISTIRSFQFDDNADLAFPSLRFLGQLPFTAPSPAGWPDTTADWTGSESIIARVEWAEWMSYRHPGIVTHPRDIAPNIFGPMLSAQTASVLRSAPHRIRALALLIASPEFQRR